MGNQTRAGSVREESNTVVLCFWLRTAVEASLFADGSLTSCVQYYNVFKPVLHYLPVFHRFSVLITHIFQHFWQSIFRHLHFNASVRFHKASNKYLSSVLLNFCNGLDGVCKRKRRRTRLRHTVTASLTQIHF